MPSDTLAVDHDGEAQRYRRWLADVLGRIAGIPHGRLHELLPWEWKSTASNPAAAQAT